MALPPVSCAQALRSDFRAGNVNGRIRSDNDPDGHGEGESPVHFSPHHQENDQHEEDGAGRNDRAAQRLVQASIHDLFQPQAAIDLLIFADTVEHNDSVIHRHTDQCKECGDDLLCDLQVQARNDVVQKGEDSQGDQHVMEQGENGSNAVHEFESQADVSHDGYEGPEDGIHGTFPELFADLRTDFVLAKYLKIAGTVIPGERVPDPVADRSPFSLFNGPDDYVRRFSECLDLGSQYPRLIQ